MSWKSVSICNSCWLKKNGNKQPVKVIDKNSEKCHFCGNQTFSGIFIRVEILDKEPRSIDAPFKPSVEQ